MSCDEIANVLESSGWSRSVAGNEDFNAAVTAIGRMLETGKGLIVSGEYGCGKTSLMNIVSRQFNPYKVRLGISEATERLTREYCEMYAVEPLYQSVYIDDLGAESQRSEYGVFVDIVGEFIAKWHEYLIYKPSPRRMFITTNLNIQQIDQRYGGRVLSRLKDIVIPLKLKGEDKREWDL